MSAYEPIEIERARRRRAWWTIGGTIAAVLVIGAAIVLFARGGNDPAPVASTGAGSAEPSTTTKPSTSTSPTPSTGTDPNASTCGLPAGDQTIPTTAPGSTWELVGTMAIPTDPKVGPGTTTEGIHTCYAHSPTGALFAAVSVMAETRTSPVEAMTLRAAPSEIRDATLEAIAGSDAPAPQDTTQQVAGFKVIAYNDQSATIVLALKDTSAGGGGMAAVTMSMLWIDGDWYWSLPTSNSTEVVSNLTGFVLWGGV